MAKATKGARHIVVEDIKYRWRASGNDGYISLVIWPAELPGPTIACLLDYEAPFLPADLGVVGQVVVTNRVVRKVIDYAVRERGYKPGSKGGQLDIRNLQDSVDLTGTLRSK